MGVGNRGLGALTILFFLHSFASPGISICHTSLFPFAASRQEQRHINHVKNKVLTEAGKTHFSAVAEPSVPETRDNSCLLQPLLFEFISFHQPSSRLLAEVQVCDVY